MIADVQETPMSDGKKNGNINPIKKVYMKGNMIVSFIQI